VAVAFWHRLCGDGLAPSGICDGDRIPFDRGATIWAVQLVLGESADGFATGILIRRGRQAARRGGAGHGPVEK